jgi:hypothetical protein
MRIKAEKTEIIKDEGRQKLQACEKRRSAYGDR